MRFEVLFDHLGDLGRYQVIQYLLLCIPAILTGVHMFSAVFVMGVPKHRCSVGSNDTVYMPSDAGVLQYVQERIPFEDIEVNETFSSCEIYVEGSSDKMECSSWVYDTEFYTTTAVTEFGLVCGNRWKRTLSTTLYMVGVLVGASVFGILSDGVGRKPTFLVCLAGQTLAGSIAFFAPDIWSYSFLRLLVAACSMGEFMTAFVMGMELIGPSKRIVAGVGIEFFWTVAYFVLTPIGYYIRDFRTIQLVISLLGLPLVSYYWLVNESIRWLIIRKRYDAAEAIIQKAALVNKVTVPKELFHPRELSVNEKDPNRDDDFLPPSEPLSAILKAPILLGRTGIIFANWVVVAFGYYSLSLNAGNFGNVFVAFLSGSAVEVLAYSLCFLCAVWGRKWIHVSSYILGATASFGTVIMVAYSVDPVENNWLYILMNSIAKFGVSIAFAIIYFWSAEIFPTPLRNSLMGFSSTAARVGAMVAPFMSDLHSYVPGPAGKYLPSVIVGTLMIMVGLLSIMLPETNKKPIPDTIEHANQWVFPDSVEGEITELQGVSKEL